MNKKIIQLFGLVGYVIRRTHFFTEKSQDLKLVDLM